MPYQLCSDKILSLLELLGGSWMRRTRGVVLLVLALAAGTLFAGEDAFSRTRHKAALLALLHFNPLPAASKDFSAQRAQLQALCRAFVQEGGYDPARTAAILQIRDPEVEHLALLIRELDGRTETLPRPGALPLAGAVALCYTLPCADGLRAAVHAARYVSADPDQAAVSKAAYSMVLFAIEGKTAEKEELLKIAAVNADDSRIEQEIRAVKLRELRKLPPESTALGKFCRAAFVWDRTQNWEQAMSMGRRVLQYPETLQFLAILCAAWGDLRKLPEDFVWTALQGQETRDLSADLYQLASAGVLTAVDHKLLLPPQPGQSRRESSSNDQPLPQMTALPGAPAILQTTLPTAAATSPSAGATATSPNDKRATGATGATGMTGMTGEAEEPNEPALPASPALPSLPATPAMPRSTGGVLTVTEARRGSPEQTRHATIAVPPTPAPDTFAAPAAPAMAPMPPQTRSPRPQPETAERSELSELPQAPEANAASLSRPGSSAGTRPKQTQPARSVATVVVAPVDAGAGLFPSE